MFCVSAGRASAPIARQAWSEKSKAGEPGFDLGVAILKVDDALLKRAEDAYDREDAAPKAAGNAARFLRAFRGGRTRCIVFPQGHAAGAQQAAGLNRGSEGGKSRGWGAPAARASWKENDWGRSAWSSSGSAWGGGAKRAPDNRRVLTPPRAKWPKK